MADLTLRTAIGSYGHTLPLKDGTAASPMFALEHIEVSPVTSIFRRMVRGLEFEVAEMALSTYLCARAHGKPFTGIPVFLTRAFYHGGIVCRRRSRIETPQDLAGKRFGLRSYTLTPGVWTRGILQAEYGVDLDAVTWVLSGDEHVAEFVAPPNVVSSPNGNLAEMLLSGEIDAAIGTGPIDSPEVCPLFADADTLDAAWHRKTGVYPISHMVVVRDDALAAQPGLAAELCRTFAAAKAQYLDNPTSNDAADIRAIPRIAKDGVVGADPIPYGLDSSRRTLETFIGYNVAQGIIPETAAPEDLFPAETLA